MDYKHTGGPLILLDSTFKSGVTPRGHVHTPKQQNLPAPQIRAPEPCDFTQCYSSDKLCENKELFRVMHQLTDVHKQLITTQEQGVSLADELGYTHLLLEWGVKVHRSQEAVLCRGRGLWFPLPNGLESNSVWAEFVYRLYRCICRFMQSVVMIDVGDNNNCEHALGLEERREQLGVLKRMLGLASWFEREGLAMWTDSAEVLRALGLEQEYRISLKDALRAYGLWSGASMLGLITTQMVMNKDTHEPGRGARRDPKEMRFMSDTGVAVRRVGTQVTRVDSLEHDLVHPLDRPSNWAVSAKLTSSLQRTVCMYYSCYVALLDLPEFVPLYGVDPAHQLCNYSDALLNKVMKSSTWTKLTDFQLSTSLQPLLHEQWEKHTDGRNFVLHNACCTTLLMRTVISCINIPVQRSRRGLTRTWSELAKTQFMVWCARYYAANGFTSTAMAFIRAVLTNGGMLHGAGLKEMHIIETGMLDAVPQNCTDDMLAIADNQPEVMATGTDPRTLFTDAFVL